MQLKYRLSRKGVRASFVACILSIQSLSVCAQVNPSFSNPAQTQTRNDADVAAQVKAALHANPYFYDEHVDVSIDHGVVVLKGFVFGEWDLRNAIRIATRAAGGRKVVDNLDIKESGRH